MSCTLSSTRSVTVDSAVLGRGQLAADHQLGKLARGDVGGSTEATVVPRRITVMSSAIASTSSSLCEMKMSVCPSR